MDNVNSELKNYIEENIFPVYENNDLGHNLDHIKYVIDRSLKFYNQLNDLNIDMVYTIAAFHDIGHYIDKDNHEAVSADIFYKDEIMKQFFDEEQRKIIKEAIEDHRASLGYEPRSIYGKIVSSADREINAEKLIKKTHFYSLKHYPTMTFDEMVDRSYNVLSERMENLKRYPIYFDDEDYNNFVKKLRFYLSDKEIFKEKYDEEIKKINS